MNTEKELKNYFEGLWSGMETPEQCNTSLTFTPVAIKRIVEHFYNLGQKDKMDELNKDAIHCKIFWYDGPLMDYTQEQQDNALNRIDAHVGDKIKLIILKDDYNDQTGSN